MFNVDSLYLDDEYTVDVKVHYSLNYSIAGILRISSKQITLEVFGETNKDSKYEYKEYFGNLECTNYLNSRFILLDVQLISSHNSRLSQNRGSFNNKFKIKEILYNKNYIMKDIKFYELSFQSEDIAKWIGNTNLQQTIIDNYYNKTLSEIDPVELIIDLEDSYLIIHYPVTTYMNSSEQKAGIHFSPVVNIKMKEEITFESLKEKYQELLNLFYLLIGYDIKVSQTLLYTDKKDTISYYYNQDLDRKNDRLIFINLGHNLRFEQNRYNSLSLKIFQNYFKLSAYKKRLFSHYRKYKIFHYTEEKFLGYFRILENIMYSKDIKFTQEHCDIYLENINFSDEKKKEEKEKLEGMKDKKTRVIDYPLKDRKNIIKFILYHNQVLNILPLDFKLIALFTDVEEIVKLRNDISHFNEYNIRQSDLEKYIDYLEFLTTYALLKFVGYTEQEFIDNLFFYPLKHKVFNLEN